ncbi:MAG: hypothetical protein WCI89_03680 [bacterium]
MEEDIDISNIKDLVQKNVAIAEDTNRTVHAMRRAQKWGAFFKFVWWAVIIVVSGATYYLYFQPYVGKIERLYEQAQIGTQQLQSFFKK